MSNLIHEGAKGLIEQTTLAANEAKRFIILARKSKLPVLRTVRLGFALNEINIILNKMTELEELQKGDLK